MPVPNRRDRAQRAYAEAFSEALRELKAPLPALCSVVKVDMSPDLRFVKVYVSLFGEGHARSESARSLRRGRAFLQGEVGRRIGLRFTPALTIETDRSIEKLSTMPDLASGENTALGEHPHDRQEGPGSAGH
jgi:ribosome-binding factor A